MASRSYAQYVFPLMLLLVTALDSPSHAADDVALLVKAQDILSAAPKIEEGRLVGRTVWVGDTQGLRGTATVDTKPDHTHDAVLSQNLGVDLALAYTSKTTFVPIEAKKLAPGAISKLVLERAKELGAASPANIEVLELARVDLDGDGKAEVLISAHSERNSSDPYSGAPGDFESILVVSDPDGQPKILDQVAKVLEADEAKSGRPHIDLVAVAQDPATERWALLMSQALQRWEDETSTVEVTIAGKTSQQTTTERTLTRTTLAAVYTLEREKLVPVRGLSYRLLSF